MCWNSVNGKLYVGLEYSDVAVVNCAVDSVEKYIAVGGSPRALCCDTVRNKVYCTGASGGVTVISGATGSVLKTIAVGSLPWDVAWVPTYGRTYVANYMDGSVSVIRDTGAPAIADMPNREERESGAPTIVRGVLFLPKSASPSSSWLRDISGRKVLDLAPGPNDLSRLAPGVYFVREQRGPAARVVVVQ
jgi:YVTN family beta-propeller protein